MLGEDYTSDDVLPWERNGTSFGLATVPSSASGTQWNWENIRACNDFLVNYEKSPVSEEVKQKYAGMILFFKTLDYFNKVKAYGDVPWFENVMNPGNEEMYKARDSRILVMDNMLRDIDQAIKWLPKKTDVTVISKDAALALKARMCLFEGTWRKYHGLENPDKFLQEAYNAAEYSASHYQGTEDAPVFRLGEIMLIRAEAAELGTITQTDLNETINKLRERVGFNKKLELAVPFDDPVIAAAYPNVSGDNAKLIREIRRERRIEMFAEGVRYDDIRRWKCGNLLTAPRLGIIIEGAGYSEKDIAALKETVGVNEDGALTIYEKRYVGQRPTPIFEEPKHYLSPIPTDEIGKAPNIKQNPGW